jgi:hypothetical protein
MDTTFQPDETKDEEVTAKYVFENQNGIPGTPKLVLFVEDKEDAWDYSTFAASTGSVNLPGVKVHNEKLKMIVVGDKRSFQDQAIDHLEDRIEEQMDNVKDKINNFVQIDNLLPSSSPSKKFRNRLLAKKDESNSSVKTTPPSKLELQDIEDQLKTKVVEMMNHKQNTSSETKMNFLSPPTKKIVFDDYLNSERRPGAKPLTEELRLKLALDLKNRFPNMSGGLKEQIEKTTSQIDTKDNSSTGNLNMRILTKTEDIMNTALETFELNKVSVDMNFFCDTSETKVTSHFLPNKGTMEINVYSSDGCVVNFEFLQILNEIPWLTGSIFLILGIGLAFFGLKVYKNLLMVFIPMMIAILGFYLYFAIVENSTTSTTKILTLVGLLVFIFALAILMVWFNWLLYMIVAFGVSCQFGLLTHAFLEQSVEFFQAAYTEWILIIVYFLIFMVMYFFIKDYFLILATAIMGSTFVALSLKYLGLTDFDLLFDTQLDKLVQFETLERSVQMVAIVFVACIIIGFIVQVILLKKEQKQEEESKKPTHDLHDTHKNIQLENI